jgi:hypothetical protein
MFLIAFPPDVALGAPILYMTPVSFILDTGVIYS